MWRLKPACGTLCGSCSTILSSLLDPVNPSLFDTSGGWSTFLDKSYTFFKLFIFLNTQLQGLHLRLRLCTGAEDNAVKEADAEAIKFAVVSSTEEEFHVVWLIKKIESPGRWLYIFARCFAHAYLLWLALASSDYARCQTCQVKLLARSKQKNTDSAGMLPFKIPWCNLSVRLSVTGLLKHEEYPEPCGWYAFSC